MELYRLEVQNNKMKARWMIMLIAFVVLSSSMGCALLKVMTGQTSPKAQATRPAPVAQATYFGTATPTKTSTPAPTATRTKTATPAPTAPPSPTIAATATTGAQEERVPAAPAQDAPPTPAPAPKKAEPTATTPPPTPEPQPMVGQHGTSALFSVVDPKPEYRNGAQLKVHIQIKNTTAAPLLFGILGINLPTEDTVDGFVSVRSSKFEQIDPGQELVTEAKVKPVRFGQVRGPATMTLTMCFSKLDECQQPGADWEVIAPPITVNIVP